MLEAEKGILLFAKYPLPGRVKTRLARTVGNETAAALYREFLLEELETLTTMGPLVHLFHDPPGSGPLFRNWLGNAIHYHPQHGSGLGERMHSAFARIFSLGIRSAVLVGSDLPDLPADHLRTAFALLDTGRPVIGPALDGGYYLIGFTPDCYDPSVFSDIQWSTPTVYDQTLRRFAELGLAPETTPPWRDVDDIADCRAYLERSKTTSPAERLLRRLLQNRPATRLPGNSP
ncbi:MAG: TIGR04282 family arsenosugar biosynthesis glycosyltransferase [Desulfovibrionales bacterium]